jgi:hypothetical protein
MIEKARFFRQFVDYSVKEEDFSFLGDGDTLAEPKRMSAPMQLLANVLGGLSGIPGGEGIADKDALVADLRKMLDCSDVVGVRLKDGPVVLRLGIDADQMSGEALIGRFAVIHERIVEFRKYAYTIVRSWIMEGKMSTIAQGVVVFSEHQKAKQFIEHYGDKCRHSAFWKDTITQPWIVDLEDEMITSLAGFWQHARMLPLNSEKARVGFFHRRGPLVAA